MSNYLITVGGTGQHFALAVTRLVRMGAMPQDLKLIALDSDDDGPLSKLLAQPTRSLAGTAHPLGDGVVKPPFNLVGQGEGSFADMFVDGQHKDESDLFDSLFTAEEGAISIHTGMHATPCVGATVFAEGANGPALAGFLEPLATANRVFVCGSVAGGTGAGMLDKLIQSIRRYYTRDELYGIFFLPWFELPQQGTAKGVSPAILERNSNHGLKYFYERTVPVISASLLLGYPGTQRTKVLQPVKVQDGNMGEYASYLQLAAAHALVTLPQALTANNKIKVYGLVHDDNREGWLLDDVWAGTKEGPTLRRRIRALRVQQNLLRFFTDEGNRPDVLAPYDGSILGSPARFQELHDSIVASCPEKPRRLGFMKEILTRFEELVDEARLCIEWMRDIFGPDGLGTDPVLDKLESTPLKRSPTHWRELQSMWTGEKLPAETTRTGGGVADHYARVLHDKVLSRRDP
ncbi:MAG: hypothetical protein IPJ61_21265 [Tessaracoccus sp.]|uniref:tubulin-like doman-containing protein n=1 Tax=Tessaracoccus sp. TaxID=1971211 RepID=UPI001EB66C83|nr:tubulin-like doman-containing protein [Tessaracoccus sp.]MBK7823519.1 hypothetical protein [Tessaracoccus sp.]